MSRQGGAVRIFLYNWPVYLATWTGAVLAFGSLAWLPRGMVPIVAILAAGALAWSALSLAVSFHVYDRSALTAGKWIPALLARSPRAEEATRWASVHAGLDAEIALEGAMPGSCVAHLDIFDERYMTAPSIKRARERTAREHPATPSSPVALSLADGACDAVIVAFTAHEIRDAAAREKFFDEVRRALRPGGRAVLVEHVRDWANFLAFGPGFLHFLPRREWLRLAEHSQLAIASERRVTPFVMVLSLEKRLEKAPEKALDRALPEGLAKERTA